MIVSGEVEDREDTEQDHTEIDDRSIHNDELDDDDDDDDDDDSDREQINYLEELKSVFESVASQGLSNYVVSGQLKAEYGVLPPAITISGCVDRLGYPLCAAQAQQLISTVNVQQDDEFHFNAEKVTILPAFLKDRLPSIVTEACAGLAIRAVTLKVEARLRALMLCSQDAQYEKCTSAVRDGTMFGSLLIQLPSMYEGGSLIVEYDGDRKTIDFSGARSGDDCYFTSFFCGCEVSMTKITSGVRLLLDFDLLVGPGVLTIPRPLLRQTLESTIRGAVAAWQRDVDGPAKLVWRVGNGPHGNHVYTLLRSISATKTQGQGQGKRQPLLRCFEVDLDKETTGTTEAGPREERRSDWYRHRYDEPESSESSVEDEMGDIDTETVTAPDNWWIDDEEDDDDDDKPHQLHNTINQPPITVETLEMETLGDEIFSDGPDGVEYESYEGTFTANYSSDVLVFWPAGTDPNDDGLLRSVKRLERQYAAAISEKELAKVTRRFEQILDSVSLQKVENPAGMFAVLLRFCTRMDPVDVSVVKRVVDMFPSVVLTRDLVDALVLAAAKYGYSLLSKTIDDMIRNACTLITVTLAFDLAISEKDPANVTKRFEQILDTISLQKVENSAGMFATLLRFCTQLDTMDVSVVKRVVDMFPSATLTRDLVDALVLAVGKYGYSLLSKTIDGLNRNACTLDAVTLAFDLATMLEATLSGPDSSATLQTRMDVTHLRDGGSLLPFAASGSSADGILTVGDRTQSSTSDDEEPRWEVEVLFGALVNNAVIINNYPVMMGAPKVCSLAPDQMTKLVMMAIRFVLIYSLKYHDQDMFLEEHIGNYFLIQPGVVSNELIALILEVMYHESFYQPKFQLSIEHMISKTPASCLHFAVKVTFCLILSIFPIFFPENPDYS